MAVADTDSDPAPEQRRSFGGRSAVWSLFALTMVVAGMALSVSMLWRGFALISEQGAQREDVCSLVFGSGCDATLIDPHSRQLGLPLAGWGIVYYATLAALLFLAWGVGESFEREAMGAALVLSLIGVFVSVVLACVMIGGVVPVCPMCLAVHGLNVVLVPVLNRISGRSVLHTLKDLAAGARYVIGGKPADLEAARWKFVGFCTAALVAVVSYQWVLIESDRRVAAWESSGNPQQILDVYAAAPVENITLDEDDPRLGPSDAPIHLVVFSSFGCPACQRFSGVLRRLFRRYGDELTIVFKHYPLAKSCNPRMKVDRFPHACEAAFAAEAAHRQGKFWLFHDLLFQSNVRLSEKSLQQTIRRCGLDAVRLQKDRSGGDVESKVSKDIAQGTHLKVDATPTVFVNRKRVRGVSFEALELIIRQQLLSSRR